MRARIYNYWFGVNTNLDNPEKLFELLINSCKKLTDPIPTKSNKIIAAFKLVDLLNFAMLEDAVIYIYPNFATVWKMEIEYMYLVQKFLSTLSEHFKVKVDHIRVLVESDSDELSTVYDNLANIFEQSTVQLDTPPKSCNLSFFSPTKIELSIKTKESPVEYINFIENSKRSPIIERIGDYEFIIDLISLEAIQDFCKSVGVNLASELEDHILFENTEFVDFLKDMEFLPSLALAKYSKKKVTDIKSDTDKALMNGDNIKPIREFIEKYYPNLTLIQGLSGIHTIIHNLEGRVVRIPIIDIGLDLKEIEIVSLDLSNFIPKLDDDEVMRIDFLEGLKFKRLMLNGIFSSKFPIIKSNSLQELAILKSNIQTIDYDLKLNLPNLKRLYLECNISKPQYFDEWDIHIEIKKGI